MTIRTILFVMLFSTAAFSQMPKIEPGVSQELAKWRAAHYSDVRYKLNLTLVKMSPVLKGTIEIRVKVRGGEGEKGSGGAVPLVLDWRKIKGVEERSAVSNVSINGTAAVRSSSFSWPPVGDETPRGSVGPPKGGTPNFGEIEEHLVFVDGVVAGENVIKLDFTSPILTSGSAITRYVDKEDGAEYIYSLFVPSDASTAFPVFDQPDLKARFELLIKAPKSWKAISNTDSGEIRGMINPVPWIVAQCPPLGQCPPGKVVPEEPNFWNFPETKPISTYVFAFAAGPFERVAEPPASAGGGAPAEKPASSAVSSSPPAYAGGSAVYVRKSQAAKFRPHAAEVFRLNGEAVKYFEEYFDYKFPWPKYDLVLIPEFPFGGMEHAGATFLREASVIFPQEPTRNDHINRATLIFHEAAHQWFGDTVTMRWFDDLWLKEGFATFTAYKALEKIMPEMIAWKVFYERVKQGAHQTDSTRGTTPIYQEIPNLSAAKSAYGNIVYNKAPAFLRQAEFYLGEDKFRAAVRSFLKKHEFGNATWQNLVEEFENVRPPGAAKAMVGDRTDDLASWAKQWVTVPGVPIIRTEMLFGGNACYHFGFVQRTPDGRQGNWRERFQPLLKFADGKVVTGDPFLLLEKGSGEGVCDAMKNPSPVFLMPNYQDYGYGVFLLDEKSRDYVLKNIQNEKDPFLRSMMWGALWDSVREGELDPREYVELVLKVLGKSYAFTRESTGPEASRPGRTNSNPGAITPEGVTLTEDESTTALLLARVGTALNYYIDDKGGNLSGSEGASLKRKVSGQHDTLPNGRVSARGGDAGGGKPPFRTASGGNDLRSRVEDMLIARMRGAETQGQRITYYRAFLNVAGSEKARSVLKEMLRNPGTPAGNAAKNNTPGTDAGVPLRTKDKFDIVTRLLVLGDPEAPGLLAQLEKTETSDEAKRFAYAARAGIATAENKAKYWKDFTENKEISESWIEAAFGPWNSIRHSELTIPYLERALRELPNHKRNRKIFFVNGWLGAFIGGQRSEEALAIVNKFLADNPDLDRDLRLKILENVDIIERAVRIRKKSWTD